MWIHPPDPALLQEGQRRKISSLAEHKPWVIKLPAGLAVKNPPASAGDTVWSLGWEDPGKGEMATSFIILAWEIPWTEEPGGL